MLSRIEGLLVRQKVALLYQALPPPEIDGLRKDAKPGGYSDSGADIAHALRARGIEVLTPRRDADPAQAMDWVYPDTRDGIEEALAAGATVLWANTVLFDAHPLGRVLDRCWIVGQSPEAVQRGDDKFATNHRLRTEGLPVAISLLAGRRAGPGRHALAELTPARLAELALTFPVVVKPVRGRGSQGVGVARDFAEFHAMAEALIVSGAFGDTVMVESFLPGEELTVTVMPAGSPDPGGDIAAAPWALPPVRRFNHHDGIAPYNGAVAVTKNSRALDAREAADARVREMLAACVKAASLVEARAPIRIDCRADAHGVYRLFDLNMKPNMTGAGRPGREDQDSLSALAARAVGWSYVDLLLAMLGGAWRETPNGLVRVWG